VSLLVNSQPAIPAAPTMAKATDNKRATNIALFVLGDSFISTSVYIVRKGNKHLVG
jgi:hypothetical protein